MRQRGSGGTECSSLASPFQYNSFFFPGFLRNWNYAAAAGLPACLSDLKSLESVGRFLPKMPKNEESHGYVTPRGITRCQWLGTTAHPEEREGQLSLLHCERQPLAKHTACERCKPLSTCCSEPVRACAASRAVKIQRERGR